MKYSLQNLFSQYSNTLMKAVYELILPCLNSEAIIKLEKVFVEKKDHSRGPERDAYDYLLAAIRSFLPVLKGGTDD